VILLDQVVEVLILFQERGDMLQEWERERTQEEGVMRINYPKAIQESEEDLTELEQRLRGQKPAEVPFNPRRSLSLNSAGL
jgi:hypothetical protein